MCHVADNTLNGEECTISYIDCVTKEIASYTVSGGTTYNFCTTNVISDPCNIVTITDITCQDCSCPQTDCYCISGEFTEQDYGLSYDNTLYVNIINCSGSPQLLTFGTYGIITANCSQQVVNYYIIDSGNNQMVPPNGSFMNVDLLSPCTSNSDCS